MPFIGSLISLIPLCLHIYAFIISKFSSALPDSIANFSEGMYVSSGTPSNRSEPSSARRAVEEAVYKTGAKTVYVMEEPLAAAVGANVDIHEAKGSMVVDIGGGTTDIAVISLGGAVESSSIKYAGDDFDNALVRYVRRKYNLLIGDQSAEKAKIAIGSVIEREDDIEYVIKGRDLIKGLPKAVTITANETVAAFEETTNHILGAIHNVLETAPPELVADIAVSGIVLTGGGSLIYGMDTLIKERTGIEAYVSEKALEAVALGAGMSVVINEKKDE